MSLPAEHPLIGLPDDSRRWIIAANAIITKINSGRYGPRTALPTAKDLAREIDTHPANVRSGYRYLARQGIVWLAYGYYIEPPRENNYIP